MYRILLDMDNTILELVDPWRIMLNNRFGTEVKYEDINCYDLEKVFGLSRKDVLGVLDEPGFFESLKPYPNVIESVDLMVQRGWEIVIASKVPAGSKNVRPGKLKWLETYLPQVEGRNIVFTSRKDLIRGDILVDDYVGNLSSFPSLKCVYSAPWNRGFTGDLRIDSWGSKSVDAIEEVLLKQTIYSRPV